MAGFAAEDLFLKRATAELPLGEILVVNGIIGGIIFTILALRRGEKPFAIAALRGILLVRNLAEATSVAFYLLALSLGSLAFVAAILQATPLVVTAAAAILLRERVGWRRWLSILVGLVGVLVILEPWKSGSDAAGLVMLVAVILLAARDVATRLIPARIGSMSVSAWGIFSTVPAGIALMLFRDEGFVLPTLIPAIDLLAALIFGLIGYYLLVSAMRLGEVSVVAPFRYTRLLFVAILAIVFLGESLSVAMIIGSVIVVGSGLYAFSRARRRNLGLSHRKNAR